MIDHLYTRILAFCTKVLTVLILSISFIFPAYAQDDACPAQVFYIENIEVSAIAETSQDARATATEKGLNDAWQRLLERITTGGQQPLETIPAAAELTAMLDYTRIVNETVLPSRYQAVFDYCFDRLRVRDYLASNNLRHAELLSAPILILPIWSTPQRPHLWRKPNPWAESWMRQLSYHDGLLNLKLPRNLATERAIKVASLLARDQDTLAKAAQLENTERVLLMVMTPRQSNDGIIVDVTADLYDRRGNFESTAYSLTDSLIEVTSIEKSIDNIAAALLEGVEDVWRNTNVVDIKDSGVVVAVINTSSLEEWRYYLNVLKSLPPVEKLSVVRLASSGGLVEIKLAGSITSLNYALGGYGLEFTEEYLNERSYLSLNKIIN